MCIHQTKAKDVLEYIKSHPGFNENRLCASFNCDVRWSLRKLDRRGMVKMEKINGVKSYFYKGR